MGNHDLGSRVGRAAQEAYVNRNPEEKAIDILARLCRGRGGDAEWEAEDPNRPGYQHPAFVHYTDPTPEAGLGMLIVEAFAPNGLSDLPKYSGVLGYVPSDDEETDKARMHEAEASTDLWYSEVYEPFKKRYGYW